MSKFQELIGKALKHWLPNHHLLENYRPDWLFGMELDFYFPELKLVVEVNGQQHYKFTPKFHSSRQDLFLQRERDRRKKEICMARGIVTVVARNNKRRLFCNIEKRIREATGFKMKRIPPSLKSEWWGHRKVLVKLNTENQHWLDQQKKNH